jgi:hypothetical protein
MRWHKLWVIPGRFYAQFMHSFRGLPPRASEGIDFG